MVPAVSGVTSPEDPMSLPYLMEARLRGEVVEPPASFRVLDAPNAPYTVPVSITDSSRHLLHGVLHANGFGHLLRINGLEGGSNALTGTCHLSLGIILNLAFMKAMLCMHPRLNTFPAGHP